MFQNVVNPIQSKFLTSSIGKEWKNKTRNGTIFLRHVLYVSYLEMQGKVTVLYNAGVSSIIKWFDEIRMKQDALFYMNKAPMQRVELAVLKKYRKNKYFLWNRKKMKHAISLTSVTKVT